MRFYGIEYQRINNKLHFYAYTHWSLSERIEIEEDTYYNLCKKFTVIKHNSYLTGSRINDNTKKHPTILQVNPSDL